MMEGLKEDLRTLSDAVPLLTKKVAETQQAVEALEAALQGLQGEVDEARRERTDHLAALREALPALAARIGADEKQLHDAGEGLGHAWTAAEPLLTQAGGALATQADAVAAHAHDLQRVLADEATKVEQVHTQGEAALAQLEREFHEAERRIQAAVHAMEAEVNVFKEVAEAAGRSIDEAAHRLTAEIETAGAATDAAVEEARAAMTAKVHAHKDAAHGVLTLLAQQLMEKVDAADGEIERAVTAPLTEAAAHLHAVLEKLAATAGSHEQDLARHEGELETSLNHVKHEADQVPPGVGQIQEAARRLGI